MSQKPLVMCIYIYIHIERERYMHICTYTYMLLFCIHIPIQSHIRIHIHVHTHTHLYIYVYTHIYVHRYVALDGDPLNILGTLKPGLLDQIPNPVRYLQAQYVANMQGYQRWQALLALLEVASFEESTIKLLFSILPTVIPLDL